MKNKHFYYTLIFSFFLYCTPVLAQGGGIQCNSNSFWATNGSDIDEYTINGSTVTFNSTVCQAFNGSLAFCDNLDSGSFSPTFYAPYINHAVFYNGTNWIIDSATWTGSLSNGGGNGSFLYFTGTPLGGSQRDIVRYDNGGFNTVYSVQDSNYYISVKDLAVDDSGNVWFFIGLNQAPWYTDSLNVISPAGQLIKQYPFSINASGAYGCFLLNDIIYVGVSTLQSLIPISIINDSAIAGALIPMVSGYIDFASCSPGLPLSIKNNIAMTSFDIYPNPTNSILNVEMNKSQNITIINILGEVILEVNNLFTQERKLQLDVSFLSAGIYLIKAGSKVTKFVKE